MSTDPTGRVSHIQDMHRGLTWKPAVRCATTVSITISTALNNGDTLDGITLATGDRVLVKNQSTASQNGIYIVGATPTRAADMDQDTTTTTIPAEEIAGSVVFVISGTVGASTIWYTTNAVGGTVGSTSITWVQFTGGSVSFATPSVVLGSSAAAGAAATVIRSDATIAAFDATSPTTQAFGDSAVVGSAAFAARRDHKHGMPTAAVTTSGLTQATAKMLGRSTAATGAIEEITVGSGLSLSAGSLTATGGSPSGSITASGYTMSTARLLGRTTAATGAVEEITVGTGLSLSGGSLTATGVGVGTGARYPVQDGAASSANTNTRTVTLGATPTNGNLLIAVSVNESTFAISSVVTTNVSWSKLAGTTVGVAPVIEIWVGTISASAGTATVITYAGSTFCNFHLAEWASVTGTLDQSATLHTTTGATSGHPIPIITPTSSTALVVCGSSTTNNSTNFSGFSGVFLMQAASSAGQTIGSYFGFPGTAPVYGIASGGASSTASSITVSIT